MGLSIRNIHAQTAYGPEERTPGIYWMTRSQNGAVHSEFRKIYFLCLESKTGSSKPLPSYYVDQAVFPSCSCDITPYRFQRWSCSLYVTERARKHIDSSNGIISHCCMKYTPFSINEAYFSHRHFTNSKGRRVSRSFQTPGDTECQDAQFSIAVTPVFSFMKLTQLTKWIRKEAVWYRHNLHDLHNGNCCTAGNLSVT